MDLSFHSEFEYKRRIIRGFWGLFWFCIFAYIAGFENRVQSILTAPEATEPILKMMVDEENEKIISFRFL